MYKFKKVLYYLKTVRQETRLPVNLFLLVVGLYAFYQLFTFSITEKQEELNFKEAFKSNYKIFSIHIPQHLDFCNEKVPIEQPDVREKLDRELLVNTYWQSNTLLNIKRAHKYFPIIEPILKKNNIPEDFKYLALIESGLTNVVSPAGAAGFWQIMKTAGRERGLEINTEVDERYHLEKATQAACDYLNQAYQKFGSWTLAAASYNMGMNGLEKQLNIQKAHSYYDLVLNEETARYIYRILAVKEILSHPAEYGFNVHPKDLYMRQETFSISIDSSISDLATFAQSIGTNYKTLKLFNPWLRKNYLTNKNHKQYEITLPLSLKDIYLKKIQKTGQDSI